MYAMIMVCHLYTFIPSTKIKKKQFWIRINLPYDWIMGLALYYCITNAWKTSWREFQSSPAHHHAMELGPFIAHDGSSRMGKTDAKHANKTGVFVDGQWQTTKMAYGSVVDR